MAIQSVIPVSAFYTTTLNSKVSGYDRLVDRMSWSLGYPLVNLEIHSNQFFENISIAVEMFTKYAGYSLEYLVFDSKLYEKGKGLRLDKLFSITPDLCATYTSVKLNVNESAPRTLTTRLSGGQGAQEIWRVNVADTVLDPTEFTIRTADVTNQHSSVRKLLLVAQHTAGDPGTTNGNFTEYNIIYTTGDDVGDMITLSLELSGANEELVLIKAEPKSEYIAGTDGAGDMDAIVVANDQLDTVATTSLSSLAFGAYDALLSDYRKVINISEFEEGSTSGVNTLFTIEQTLAQQTYFSYSMGNYGFDLISWYTVKEWLETRSKMLSQTRSWAFNPHTQYMRLYPEPKTERFYGVVACYVEKRIEDIIHEPWIYQYSLALSKIAIGRVRSKYTGTNLFGGGSLEAEILAEGKEEKDKLETMLFEGSSPGMGDSDPPMFFVG